MEKKLPGVFANKVNKDAGNNNKIFYSSKNNSAPEPTNEVSLGDRFIASDVSKVYKNINQKINAIFNSSNYIYKADVEITLKDGKIMKRIVGKNGTHLITMENELIPISDVIDIERR